MTVRIQRLDSDQQFFDMGLRLLESAPDRFPRSNSTSSSWEELLSGKRHFLGFDDGVSLGEVLSFVWFVMDELVNSSASSGYSRGFFDGRWSANGDRNRVPQGLSVVVADGEICYGCGKRRGDSSKFNLEIGPFEVPCCSGRGEFYVKRSCRHAAMENLACCCLCGRMVFETRGGGRVCRVCSGLVDDGLEFRKSRGATEQISSFFPGISSPLREGLSSMLRAMGAKEAYGSKLVVPALAVGPIDSFVSSVSRSVEEAHQKGLDRGKNLLLGLAEGTVSVADFNATEGASRR